MQRWLHTPPQEEPVPLPIVAAAAETSENRICDRPNRFGASDQACGFWMSSLPLEPSVPIRSSYGLDASSFQFVPEIPWQPMPDLSSQGLEAYGLNEFGYDFPNEPPQVPYDSGSMSAGASSVASAGSYASGISHGSWAGRRGRKRCKVELLGQRQDDEIYQCTWCYRGFTRRDSWKRHEESEHCPIGEYVCMINGPTDNNQDQSMCVFCSGLDSSAEHLQRHRVNKCLARPETERSFARLDSLQQHIKQMHPNSTNTVHPSKFYRRLAPPRTALWCGFCKTEFIDWTVQVKHVANHFTSGWDMSSWTPKTLATASCPPVFGQGLSSPHLADPSSLVSLQVEGCTSKEVAYCPIPMDIDVERSDNIQASEKEVDIVSRGEATARSRFWKTRRKEIFKKQNYFSKQRLHFYQMEQECSRDIIRLESEKAKIGNKLSSQDSSSPMKRLVCQIQDLLEERRYYRCELAYFCGLIYDVGTSMHGIRVIHLAQTTRVIKRRVSIY